jgi:ankyrin repeat protein
MSAFKSIFALGQKGFENIFSLIKAFSLKNMYNHFKTSKIELYYNQNKDDKLIKLLKNKGKKFYINFTFKNKSLVVNDSTKTKKNNLENEFENNLVNSEYSILHQSIYDNRAELFTKMFVSLNFFKDKEVLENKKNILKLTPLQLSCCLNNLLFFEALIEMGSDYNDLALGGLPLVHLSCVTGSVLCLDYLISNLKFDVNLITENKMTPLHLACQFGKFDSVNYLIENQADIYFRENGGLSPLEICVLNDHKDLMILLKDHYYNEDKLFDGYSNKEKALRLVHLAATSKKGIKCLVELLKNIENVNLLCNDIIKSTPLHFAVLDNNLPAVNCLLRYNANLSMKDYLGNTPLHYACDVGNIKVIRALTEYGAKINIKNNDGLTPYQIAINHDDKDIKLYFIGLSSNKMSLNEEDYKFKDNKTLI